MNYLSLTVGWLLFFSVSALGLITQGGLRADPTDDFSFSYAQAPVSGGYNLMPERRVLAIFKDHLSGPTASWQKRRLAHHLVQLCRRYRFDPAFVLSLIEVESRFRPSVVSPAGAVGLMQLMPATARVVAKRYGIRYTGSQEALKDPFTNLTIGVAYLSYLRDKYGGDSSYSVLAAYNMGPAKFDGLRSKKGFKPVKTKSYFEKIRRGVGAFRFYESQMVNRPDRT